MSHFNVAVFTTDGDYESLLAPYNEQDQKYMRFCPCNETQEEAEKEYQEVNGDGTYASFADFMRRYYGYEKFQGVWGSFSNPDAKWDWWQEGGRWEGSLRRKNGGEHTNEATVSEIDWSPDPAKFKQHERFWEVAVEGAELLPDEKKEDFLSFWKPAYYLDQYGSKENYAKVAASSYPFAMITSDGEWHEVGEMGWFGCHSGDQESRDAFYRFFDEYVAQHPDEIVTIIDCHI